MRTGRRQRGFALFEVFLAAVLLALVFYGISAGVSSYRTRTAVVNLENTVEILRSALAPFTGVDPPDAQNFGVFSDDVGQFKVSFLTSLSLQGTSVDPSHPPYVCTHAYLSSSSDNTVIAGYIGVPLNTTLISYLVLSFQAQHQYAVQIAKDLASRYSIYTSDGSMSVKALSLADTDPKKIENVYLVYPKVHLDSLQVGHVRAQNAQACAS
jgi:hypothetical protein